MKIISLAVSLSYGGEIRGKKKKEEKEGEGRENNTAKYAGGRPEDRAFFLVMAIF